MPTRTSTARSSFSRKAGRVSLAAAVGVVAVNRNRYVSARWIHFGVLRTYPTYSVSYMHTCNHTYVCNCTAVHNVYPVFSDRQIMS